MQAETSKAHVPEGDVRTIIEQNRKEIGSLTEQIGRVSGVA
jgi:hypothetical protein